jgi:transposase
VQIVRKKDINNSIATGDSADYGLTTIKNYELCVQSLNNLVKESPENIGNKGKTKEHEMGLFVHSFNIMDLGTRLYITIGESMKSGRQAYDGVNEVIALCKRQSKFSHFRQFNLPL